MRSAVWFATWKCNLHCPYCWQRNGDVPAVIKNTEGDDHSLFWPKKLRLLAALDLNVLDITGGEPLLVPGIPEIITGLPKQTTVGITTNGTQLAVMRRLIEENTNERIISWTLSWHPTHSAGLPYIAEELRRKDFHVTVNHVLFPGQIVPHVDSCKQFCKEQGITYHADRYSPPLGLEAVYTEEEQRYIDAHVQPDRTAQRGQGYCNAGIDHYVLTPDMKTWPCIRGLFEGWTMPKVETGPLFCDDFYRCAGCDRDKVVTRARV